MAGLYIHLPFCSSKCAYCGFYSAVDSSELQEKYLSAVLDDVKASNINKFDTLYIGGGTPSSVNHKLLSNFLSQLFSLIPNDFIESTIEGNPESIDENFLSVVSEYSFSRLSIGCQSTHDETLRHLTRKHNRNDIFNAVQLAQSKCPNTALNLDMIFDIPEASPWHTAKTIADLVSFAPQHISAYNYSHDTGHLAGKTPIDDTEYTQVTEKLASKGYGKYEISNFSLEGHESLHNINYWKLGDYYGAGASAWSLENLLDKRILKGKVSDIIKYIESPTEYQDEDISEGDQLFVESIVFGLRMAQGVDIKKLAEKYGTDIQKYEQTIENLKAEGLIKWESSNISLTGKGELLLDSVQELFWQSL
jgi:oxygen-independent coproporphyrinogen-3 oxidase